MTNTNITTQVISAIQSVIGDGRHALHEPVFSGNESKYLQECIDTTFVSSVGKFVDRFEVDLAKYTGAAHAVVTVNGTSALQTALILAGVQPGDEVLVPALTFIATANAVAFTGAIPHLVEVEESTLGIDPDALRSWLQQIARVNEQGQCINLRTGRRITALVPVHVFGHPCKIVELVAVSQEFGLVIVEDAAESLGSFCNGQHTGTFGTISALSFNGNKIVTSGGGGAILTNNAEMAARAKHITTTAKVPHQWEYYHSEVGFNFRMPNINAALGCAQLEQIEGLRAKKRLLFTRYFEAFASVEGVRLMKEPLGCESNYWLQTIVLHENLAFVRDSILEQTNAAGIQTRPAWRLMHHLPMYENNPRSPVPTSESLERRIINLPSSASIV